MSLETLKWQLAMGADEAVLEVPTSAASEPQLQPVATTSKPQPTAAEQPNDVTPAKAGVHTPDTSSNTEKPAIMDSGLRRNDKGANTQHTTPTPPTPPSELEAKARELADKASTREELRAALEGFEGLAIQKTAKNLVFSDGNPEADIMFIGEAPGANEDEQGIPFCGASGQLMDKAVAHIGLTRDENWYISNTIFWRPPGNRTPTKEEVAICRPFVEKHIALINPKLLVLVGGTAANSLMDDNRGITRLRGQFKDYTNPYLEAPISMTAIFHPSFLLRSPGKKKDFWFDLLAIKRYIASVGER